MEGTHSFDFIFPSGLGLVFILLRRPQPISGPRLPQKALYSPARLSQFIDSPLSIFQLSTWHLLLAPLLSFSHHHDDRVRLLARGL